MRVDLVFQIFQFGLQVLFFQFFQVAIVPDGFEQKFDCYVESDHENSQQELVEKRIAREWGLEFERGLFRLLRLHLFLLFR